MNDKRNVVAFTGDFLKVGRLSRCKTVRVISVV